MQKIRPFFSDKNNHGTNIKLVDEILNNDEKTAEELDNFFQNAISNFIYTRNLIYCIESKYYHNLSDPVQGAITKYKHHPNLLLIQSKISNRYKFSLFGSK